MSNPEEFIPPSIEEIAALLPAYDVISFIAKGGMGAVYMANQRSLDRMVAIKILPRAFGSDQIFREAFEQEAKSMAKFNHPNLVSIYDFGQIDGMLYFIMEMVKGKPLYYSCYGKKIDPTEANRIIVDVCGGLHHAHKHGILHRDIKPANILLAPNAIPKIADFGLARGVEDHESDQAFGTLGYTAPEVTDNPTAVRECTDIYSVGVMLYELLISKIPEEPYIPVTTIVRCDPRYDQIILKAINPNPAMRYQSAKEMSKALKNIAKSSPKNQTPANSVPPTPSTNVVNKPTEATPPTQPIPQPKQITTSNFTRSSIDNSSTTRAKKPNSSKNRNHPKNQARSVTTPATTQLLPKKNDTFTRNIIIIVALFGVILAAWQGLQKRAAANATTEKTEHIDKNSQNTKKTSTSSQQQKKHN